MDHPHYLVPTSVGKLYVMPCPPAAEMREILSALKEKGVTHIVSMLPTDEARVLGAQGEAVHCKELGLAFLNFPIEDFGLPTLAPFAVFVRQVANLLNTNAHVAVHCKAGIGRSGMVAASTLVALGNAPQLARETVSLARGCPIPDTAEQGKVISEIVARLSANS